MPPFCISRTHSPASFRASRPGTAAHGRFRALFVLSTRKTKSRRPPVCGRALLRSDNRVTVKHRGRSLANSDTCCQWQRLSFICRGDLRRQRFEKRQRSQRINRAAVPTKQSSPPAEKCGVCIGATVPSQAEMAEKSTIQGYPSESLAALLRSHPSLLDDAKIFRTLVLHKILELGDRHRRDDGACRL